MVAVPGAREAPVILGTGIGMAMPKMECKINLRGGNQDAWRRWLVNRNDVITAPGLPSAAGAVHFSTQCGYRARRFLVLDARQDGAHALWAAPAAG